MGDYFKCPICGNDDENKLGIKNGQLYCRACISFKGQPAIKNNCVVGQSSFSINYSLTDEQKRISDAVLLNFMNGKDTLIDAVCGAGKTELVFQVIDYALNSGLKVGFTVPRREVVIEIAERFKNVFHKNRIITVYGGNTDFLDGEIICLTTHQLYRYRNYFDLIIFDEIDAFPYDQNSVLESFFNNSYKGNCVILSATPPEKLLELYKQKNKSILSLNTRYHGHLLPVPKIIILPHFLSILYLIHLLRKYTKSKMKVFVFVPTIDKCEKLHKFLLLFFHRVKCVHSKKKDKEKIISEFKKGEHDLLITTSLLERGVTFSNLQVVVMDSCNKIFQTKTLIQISGRVGRKKDHPTGEVIFIGKRKSKEMENSVETIRRKNLDLQNMF
ncbi:MAG: helicase-related protein [Erysipelotrichaceae bacterium]|nr:helicase-related protein [Erysipelotrichaceae bacterium]